MTPINYHEIKHHDTLFTRLIGHGDLGWNGHGTVALGNFKDLVLAEQKKQEGAK